MARYSSAIEEDFFSQFQACHSKDADAVAMSAAYNACDIKSAMVHSDEYQTLEYVAEHDLPYEDIEVVIAGGMIKNKF